MVERFTGPGGNQLLTGAIARQAILHRNKDLDARLVEIGDLPGAHGNVVRGIAEGRSSERKEDTCCKE
jgi:hypothetical protein